MRQLARHGKGPTVSRLLTCSLLPPLNDPQTAPGPPPRPEPAQIVRADKVRRVQFAFRSQMLVTKQLESPLLLIGCDSAVDNTSLSKVELYYTVGRRSIVRAARATKNNQPTKNDSARPVYTQKWPKMHTCGQKWPFLGKHPCFFQQGAKVMLQLHTYQKTT